VQGSKSISFEVVGTCISGVFVVWSSAKSLVSLLVYKDQSGMRLWSVSKGKL